MGSPSGSVRKTKGHVYSQTGELAAGRTPLTNRPLLRREPNPRASARLTDLDVAKILQHLTQRDLVLLTALHDYRYLDTRLLELLFFPSSRSTQIRIMNLNQGDSATLDAGACAAVGDCQVVGTYLDANVTFQLYTESEVDGVWQVATQLGHLQKFDPRGDPSFSTIKCSTISDCTATGSYLKLGDLRGGHERWHLGHH